MKIKTEPDLSCNEIEVTIKYPQKDRQVNRIIDFLQSFDMQIRCDIDNTERMINILDIYYIESVDKKTFVYLEKTVYPYGLSAISAKRQVAGIWLCPNQQVLYSKVYISRKYLGEVKKALRGDYFPPRL